MLLYCYCACMEKNACASRCSTGQLAGYKSISTLRLGTEQRGEGIKLLSRRKKTIL